MKVKLLKSAIFLQLCALRYVYGVWVSTTATRQTFEDGSDGQCEYLPDDSITPTCITGWQNLGRTEGPRQDLDDGSDCSSFSRLMTFVCYRNPEFEGKKDEICRRKRYFYYMRRECYTLWLPWEECDESCGGGTSRRYKFLSTSSMFEVQERTCNTQSCPYWSKWTTNEGECDKTCSRIWSRQCLYQGDVVDFRRCPSDYSNIAGNLTHQSFPCLDDGCSITNEEDVIPPEKIEPSLNPDKPDESKENTKTTTKTTSTTLLSRVTSNKPETDNEVDIKDEFRIDYDSQIVYGGRVIFASTTFWVGVFVGVALVCFILILLFIIFSKSKKGKSTIAAFKVVKKEQKFYHDDNTKLKRSASSATSSSTYKKPLSYPVNRKSSINSYSSYKKDIYSTQRSSGAGSVSGHSARYRDSWKGIEPIEYGTYYTPVGQSKLLNHDKHLPLDQLYVDMPTASQHTTSVSDFSTDSDGELSPRVVQRTDGAFYYNKYSSNPRPKRNENRDYEDESYVRKYRRHHHDTRVHRSASSGHAQRRPYTEKRARSPNSTRRHHKRSPPVDNDREDPKYAKPMKRRTRQVTERPLPQNEEETRSDRLQTKEDEISIPVPKDLSTDRNASLPPPPPPHGNGRAPSSQAKHLPDLVQEEATYSSVPDDEEGFSFPTPPFVETKNELIDNYKSDYPERNHHRVVYSHPYDPPLPNGSISQRDFSRRK